MDEFESEQPQSQLAIQVPRVPKDKYRVLFELGRGGMGSVLLVLSQGPIGFNKLQVLKLLKSELASDAEFLNMFLEEARLSARIIHPNVVQTHEVGFDGEHYFMAMEYLDGQSLHAAMRRGDRKPELTLPMHLRVIAEMLHGLHHAHELTDFDGKPLSVVHRDVSPQNVFITYDGSIKILDFGIAKAADSSTDTRTGVIKGKVAYMAPEQFRGKIDRRVDVYAAGAMLWQALTGHRLWKGMTDVEIYTEITKSGVPKPSASTSRAVPPELEAICLKAMAFDPNERYATAAEFQQAIEDWLSSNGAHVSQRDVGKCVSELFADRRTEARAAIDKCIKQIQAEANGATPQSLHGPPVLSQTLSISASKSSVQLAVEPPPPSSMPPPARKPNMLVLAAVAAVALGALIFALSHVRSEARAQTAEAAPPVQSVAPAVATAPRPAAPSAVAATTTVKITVSPADAKVFFDDVLLHDRVVTFPRDGAAHKLRVEANGYERHDELVTFSGPEVQLSVSLDKVGAKKTWTAPKAAATNAPTAESTAIAAPPPAPPPPAAEPPPAAPTTPAKKKDDLDKVDPWAH